MVNIADDMCLRLQSDVTAVNRAFDCSIHNHVFGRNDSIDMGPAGDDEGGAVKFTVNLSIDLD